MIYYICMNRVPQSGPSVYWKRVGADCVEEAVQVYSDTLNQNSFLSCGHWDNIWVGIQEVKEDVSEKWFKGKFDFILGVSDDAEE